MKGMKYGFKLRLLNGNIEDYGFLTMNELLGKLKIEIKNNYDLDIKTSTNIIYNLIHRDNCNKFLKKICIIEKIPMNKKKTESKNK